MIDIALTFAMGGFAAGLLLTMARILRAPTMADRVLALDTMVVNVIALIVLYGIQNDSDLAFDIAVLFALTGFVSTVALAKFLLRGNIIE
ncbi:K+/H+ antiporter subunit F [Neogemmobacter tilapiae]|uniref:K+/H+ antiporter subunit F n=1 Tax=Neogemmobacter tilapiae TaxID=875041 RepID=A0A918TFZ7_9RHOB|nr:K+/H+ antiporter subunit F [Gemmobacter tilapiae]GHC47519.1 K+/H+ antiporter subunit F [Gemmobacter tilapiae]